MSDLDFVSMFEKEISALTDLDTDTVDSVLLHHIVSANVQSDELSTGTVSTLGGDISADTSDFTLTDGNGRESNIVTTLVEFLEREKEIRNIEII